VRRRGYGAGDDRGANVTSPGRRNHENPLRLHGQHLPLADGGGRDALARARGRAGGRVRDRQRGNGRLARRQPARRPRDRERAPAREGEARRVRRDDFEHYDLLLAADRENLAELRALAPNEESRSKARLLREFDPGSEGAPDLDVPDPYYGGPDGFEDVLDLVEAACRGLLEHARSA
jgi:hypothetical protein